MSKKRNSNNTKRVNNEVSLAPDFHTITFSELITINGLVYPSNVFHAYTCIIPLLSMEA